MNVASSSETLIHCYQITWRHIPKDSVLIRSYKMQQYAGIYLLQVYSTCFERPSRRSSGEQKTVNAASGTGRSYGAKTFLQRDLIRPRWRKIVAQIL